MTRACLRPSCLEQLDARTLADEMIGDLERTADRDRVERYLARAETTSPWLAPTIIGPSLFQEIWRLRFYTHTLELSTARVIEQLISELRCEFVDVGAHVGYFSVLAARCRASRITAIEMHEPNFRLLEMNVPSAAKLVLAAAGRAKSTQEYYVGRGHSNHSLIFRHDTSHERKTCEVSTLDTLLEPDAGAFRIVKIDVQGHELEVFMGFQEGLRCGNSIFIFEIEHNKDGDGIDTPYTDAIGLLIDFKYRVFSIGKRTLTEIASANDALLSELPTSSNVLAVASRHYSLFEEMLHRRGT